MAGGTEVGHGSRRGSHRGIGRTVADGAHAEGHGGGGGHDGAGAMRWLLTYADLITLLLAFFVVMYAMSEVNVAKYQALAASLRVAFATAGETVIDTDGISPDARKLLDGLMQDTDQPYPPGSSEEERLAELVEEVNAALREAGLGGLASAELTERGVAITFQEQVFFDLGKADLRVEGRDLLRRLAPILAEVPGTILVEGHTDDLPIRGGPFASNWELSTARATRVVRFLAEQAGLDPRRLAAAGYGEWRPRYPNDSEAHRARNRRVEIVLLRQGLDPTARGTLP